MKIVLIGSGNVASNLGAALRSSGNEILQVWSRNRVNAEVLARCLNAEVLTDFDLLSPDADVYFLAVADDAIRELACSFKFSNKLLVHTSGTTGMEALKDASTQIGVFYPIQTFSKNTPIDFSCIPIAIEGDSPETVNVLTVLASAISGKVIRLDSKQRKAVHVAAVLACNFSNHLYTLAKDVLDQNNLDFDLIRPLILETAEKIQRILPEEAQTGPAVREDNLTLKRHLEFLQNEDELTKLYQLFTESIITKHRSQ